MSLYEKTISFILQYIEEQQLETGAKLPTEPELAAMAGVSLVTIRRALSELAAKAVVRREQGRGTFLMRSRVSAETTKVGGLHNGLSLDAQSSLKTRLLHLDRRAATDTEIQRLGLAEGASVWEVSRLRLLENRPVIHEISVIPTILAPTLAQHFDQAGSTSLYATLESEFGLREAREEQTLVCRPADTVDVKLLALRKADWVVEIHGVSYTTRHVPIDCFRMVFDAKGFSFRLETAPTSVMEAVAIQS